MPEQPEADLPFECRLCRFWLPLDDVQLLMRDGWQCICLRCWRRETEGLVPEPGTGERSAPPHLPFAPSPEAAAQPDDGVVRLRWWCNACQAELHIPLTSMRRPACPICGTALRRWDERFPPDRRR